jgi:putative membrane protein (TIGR04086 family)
MPKIIKTKIKNSKKKKKYSTKTTYILSAVKGLVFSLNGFFLISLLLHKGNDFNLFYKIMIYLVIGLGGFISGFIAHSRVKGRAFLDGIIPSVIYVSFLSFVMILLLKLNFSSHILIIYPIAVISGFLGGIIKA